MARRTSTCSIIAAGLVGLIAWGPRVARGDARAGDGSLDPGPAAAPVPVLVELFTSEGCSSCPPADALLTRLAAAPRIGGAEVIPLAFHVDYWDRLGWKDRFSSAAFTERQNHYALAWNTDRIYTPQAVVDGRIAFVGSDEKQALDAFAASAARPHAMVSLAPAADDRPAARRLRVSIDPPAAATDGAAAASTGGRLDHGGDVLLAIAEDGLTSEVTAGENASRRLAHTGVVRRLTRIGRVGRDGRLRLESVEVPIDAPWRDGRLRAVVFVQDGKTREIRGTGQLAL